MLTPKELRRVIIETAIEKFHEKWMQEIINGTNDEDIRVRISSINNYELIQDEFNPDVYTVYKDGEDTFVKMRVFTNEEIKERSEIQARTMMST